LSVAAVLRWPQQLPYPCFDPPLRSPYRALHFRAFEISLNRFLLGAAIRRQSRCQCSEPRP
jgi:hypothetical protein